MNLSLSRARLGAIKFGIGIFCILVGGSLPIQSAAAASLFTQPASTAYSSPVE